MKALLNKATLDKPVSFAFGLGKDANVALLKMDKLKNPKAVDKLLGDQFADLKTSRWGTVSFDEAAATLKFQVNKTIGNVAHKLVKTLKGTGFSKVEIVLEDGTVVEKAGEDEAAEPGEKPDTKAAEPDRGELVSELTKLVHAIPAAVAADPRRKETLNRLAAAAASVKTDLTAAPAALGALRDALAAATPGDAGAERSELAASLRDLVQHIPGALAANPGAKETLTTLAGQANALLKSGDLAGAGSSIGQLRQALEGGDDTRDRLDDLAAQASVLPEPARSALLDRIKQSRGKPDSAAIEALADAIAQEAGAARVVQAKAEAGNTVSYRVLQREWNDAEARAQAQFDAFLDALLGDAELQADERFPALQAQAGWLASLIPDDGGSLTVALGLLDDADEAQRPQAQKRAMSVLESYVGDLESAQELAELQAVADEYFGGQKFVAELQSALTDLRNELAKR